MAHISNDYLKLNDDGTPLRKHDFEDQKTRHPVLFSVTVLGVFQALALIKAIWFGSEPDDRSGQSNGTAGGDPSFGQAGPRQEAILLAPSDVEELKASGPEDELQTEKPDRARGSGLYTFSIRDLNFYDTGPIDTGKLRSPLVPATNDNIRLYGATPGSPISLPDELGNGSGSGGGGGASGGGAGPRDEETDSPPSGSGGDGTGSGGSGGSGGGTGTGGIGSGPDSGSEGGGSSGSGGSGGTSNDPRSNRLPTVSNFVLLSTLFINEARAFENADLLRGASDSDGDDLQITNLKVSSGHVISTQSGGWLYIPEFNDRSVVKFTYDINDGYGSITQQAYLPIAALPHVPLSGTDGDDDLKVDPFDELIALIVEADDGNDVIRTGSGDDIVFGGDGDDVIHTGAGNDVIFAGPGNDRVYAGADDDVIYGEDDDDELYGEDGNDKIEGGNGKDVLSGGQGDDLLIGGADDDYLDGGSGNDRLIDEEGDNVVSGGDGDDSVFTGAGRDVITSDAGNDLVNAGGGDDVIDGRYGDDVLQGEDGNDYIEGGTGEDRLSGGSGNDLLIGGADNDYIDGGSGDDRVISETEDGDDHVEGGTGNDTFISATDDGVDKVSGGDGYDVFVAASIGQGDIFDGEAGCDTYDASAVDIALIIDLRAGTVAILETNASIAESAEDNEDVYATSEDSPNSLATFEPISTYYDDLISVASIDENTVANTSVEAPAIDVLVSVENVIGGSGDDLFIANNSVNEFTGGEGEDVFVFQTTASTGSGKGSRDKILDFEIGDRIDIDDISEEFADSFVAAFDDPNIRKFVLISQGQEFSKPGEVRFKYDEAADVTILEGNIDRDTDTEFEIEIQGLHELHYDRYVYGT